MPTHQDYALFVNQVNKLTERRQAVTSTYLSVNAAIVGAIAFILKDVSMIDWGKQLSVLMLLVAGVIACTLWRKLINQYSDLLSWWYTQLRQFEIEIQDNPKLLTREYQEVYQDATRKVPMGITRYETRLTWIFTGIYSCFGLVIVSALLIW